MCGPGSVFWDLLEIGGIAGILYFASALIIDRYFYAKECYWARMTESMLNSDEESSQ